MGGARKAVVLSVGDVVNNIEILEVFGSGGLAKDRRYRVRRGCCKKEMVMSHLRLLVLRRQCEPALCESCEQKSGERSERARRQQLRPSKQFVNGWGWTLGKMGHRHSEGGVVAEVIGLLWWWAVPTLWD